MEKDHLEWFAQAEYDIEAAEIMFKGKKYLYAVFMCHLAVEKALKGIYYLRLNRQAPKTHNLVYLVEKTELAPPADLNDFLEDLNRVSIPTRYPDVLMRMVKEYDYGKAGKIIKQSKKVLQWLKGQF